MSDEPESYSKAVQQWELSPETPIAPVRCTTVRSDGTRCNYAAIPGQNRCLNHGAEVAEAHQVIEAARSRLAGMVGTALETFDDVMKNSTNDSARIKAASEILDRSGIKEDTNINVNIEDKSQVRAEILSKLEKMKLEDVEDAEIVEE